MKQLKVLAGAILISVLTLSGCANDSNKSNTSENNYITPIFEVDSNTIKNENIWQMVNNLSTTEDTDDYEVVEPEEFDNISMHEIKLLNSDNSTNYEIAGSDIKYNGTTFVGLYNAVTNCELPCDINTFINFIVKTYYTNEDTIYIAYSNDNLPKGEDDTALNLSESLSDNNYYHTFEEKYNQGVNWSISLMGLNENVSGTLYGCNQYIIYYGTKDIEIDMSKYDYGTNSLNTTENETQLDTKQNTEETLTEQDEPNGTEVETHSETENNIEETDDTSTASTEEDTQVEDE